jgi:protein TonB
MPRLRITALLSALAILFGVTGTALLSDWTLLHGGSAEAAWVADVPDSKPPPPRRHHARAPTAVTRPVTRVPSPPRPLFAPSPRYPIEALRAHREGVVMLRVQVDGAGHVIAVRVARSSGDPELDAAARDAVRRWTFQVSAASSGPPPPLLLPVRFRIGA